MDLEEFLRKKQTSIEQVLASANEEGQLIEEDTLIVVGSLSEGLATLKSDMDLILVTDRDPKSISKNGSIAWVNGKCLVDMEIVHRSAVQELVTRFKAWIQGGWGKTFAANFSSEERKLLHRYLKGIYLNDSDNKKQNQIVKYDEIELSRLKLHCARHTARSIQVDVVGHKQRQDYRSITYAAIELLGHAIDALLASHYITNPMAKWRSRLLESLPDIGLSELDQRFKSKNADDIVWHLHKIPEHTPQAILEQAHEIVTFCRWVFLYAEIKLVHPHVFKFFKVITNFPLPSSDNIGSPTLPLLEFDVDFHINDDKIFMARLNEFDEVLSLSSTELSLVMQFNGKTHEEEALSNVFQKKIGVEERNTLNKLLKAFDQTGLLAKD
ncbi:hypothetical protein [uncultured Shewanella sp.]|uniref:hypothetical protein n=1 Tax=uncultured Shewanella sp. TaxID=173975 RepID=UPI002618871D|nr:hypothetical protein [uncultured Shewanella sp.]